MDTQRSALLIVFLFSLFMLWDGWQRQSQPPVAEAPVAAESQVAQSPGSQAPVPTLSSAAGAADVPPIAAAVAQKAATRVVTDLFAADVSAEGGSLIRLELLKHRAGPDSAGNFVLLDNGTEHLYHAQSGLIGEGLPTHKTTFQLPEGEIRLADGQDKVELRMTAPGPAGVTVTKVLVFRRGSYQIDTVYEIANESGEPVSAHAYFQVLRDGIEISTGTSMLSTFTGPAFYTEEGKYQKVHFDDINKGKAKFVSKATDGWVALVQHYFVTAFVPAPGTEREFFARKVGDNLYTAGVVVPMPVAEPGASSSIDVPLYTGPQIQSSLLALAPGLDRVVDYGWLTIIASPMHWVLEKLHGLVGNWGWAIILLTVLLKALFFPLSAASYRSMAKLRLVTPRMQKIKELHGGDRVRMQQEMMQLYKTEKINPLGGCLPIVIQIPVFIALYWVLLGSVEMRNAPWIGWITDLSVKDPFFVMPVIMGITMFVQTKLNPTPPDPIQAKVMLFLPVVFTGMFLFFPAGLVLYWTVNNILSIAQQWQITRTIEGEKAKTA
ncbi:MAG: membrane protein insertase YidC [Gammaproteobacteria bacterium]|jgi:YidC/Oxa1 family membrane protein insertase|nr:membrane protein insertase YidC [Gammaproteobacteria bacterium]MBU0772325.1 membrane protein insertase YidC [Gammaproteobacteria bacterium]MBU0857936.1 membrane protein insertase YidC [Gammaproteobacteria bacterium]MBU1848452.1 membrane protein insertase YidC [Gammaproteobacteria bacterium]